MSLLSGCQIDLPPTHLCQRFTQQPLRQSLKTPPDPHRRRKSLHARRPCSSHDNAPQSIECATASAWRPSLNPNSPECSIVSSDPFLSPVFACRCDRSQRLRLSSKELTLMGNARLLNKTRRRQRAFLYPCLLCPLRKRLFQNRKTGRRNQTVYDHRRSISPTVLGFEGMRV